MDKILVLPMQFGDHVHFKGAKLVHGTSEHLCGRRVSACLSRAPSFAML